MTIRCAVPDDVPTLSAVETECFPPAEAATATEFVVEFFYFSPIAFSANLWYNNKT